MLPGKRREDWDHHVCETGMSNMVRLGKWLLDHKLIANHYISTTGLSVLVYRYRFAEIHNLNKTR